MTDMENTKPKKEYKAKTISFSDPAPKKEQKKVPTPLYHEVAGKHPVYPKGLNLRGFLRGVNGLGYNEVFFADNKWGDQVTPDTAIRSDWFGVVITTDTKRTQSFPPLPKITNWNDFLNLTGEEILLYFRYYASSHTSGMTLPHLMGMPSAFRELIPLVLLSSATKKALYVSMVTEYLQYYVETTTFSKSLDHISFNEAAIRKMGDEMYEYHKIETDGKLYSSHPFLSDLIKKGYSGNFLDDLIVELNYLPRLSARRVDVGGVAPLVFITKNKGKGRITLARGDYEGLAPLLPSDVIAKLPPLSDLMLQCRAAIQYLVDYNKLKENDKYPSSVGQLPEYSELGSRSLRSNDPILGERMNRDASEMRVYLADLSLPSVSELEFAIQLMKDNAIQARYAPTDRAMRSGDHSGVISPITYERNQMHRGAAGARESHRMLEIGLSLSFLIEDVLSAYSYAYSKESGDVEVWAIEFAKYFENEENYKTFFLGANAHREIQKVMLSLSTGVTALAHHMMGSDTARNEFKKLITKGVNGFKDGVVAESDEVLRVLRGDLDARDVELTYQSGIVTMKQLMDTDQLDRQIELSEWYK